MNPYSFKVNVSTIIREEDRYLLARRSDDEEVFPGYWGIPGGTVEERIDRLKMRS